jgi:hypothetical protein
MEKKHKGLGLCHNCYAKYRHSLLTEKEKNIKKIKQRKESKTKEEWQNVLEKRKTYREKNKDIINKKQRRLYEKNKERYLTYTIKDAIINKKKHIERNRLYKEKNREILNKKQKEYYKKNKKIIRKQFKIYYKTQMWIPKKIYIKNKQIGDMYDKL